MFPRSDAISVWRPKKADRLPDPTHHTGSGLEFPSPVVAGKGVALKGPVRLSGTGVTEAGASSHCHSYGLAVDVTIHVDGNPRWNPHDSRVLAGLQSFGQFSEVLGRPW
ncbi:MAG: hypothetical protein ABS955_09035 [Stenotrophomonas maltophilia]